MRQERSITLAEAPNFDFKSGDRVRLINNDGMAAPLGSEAVVVEFPSPEKYNPKNYWLKVKWDRGKGNESQNDGHYSPDSFEKVTDALWSVGDKFIYTGKGKYHTTRYVGRTGIIVGPFDKRGIEYAVEVKWADGSREGGILTYNLERIEDLFDVGAKVRYKYTDDDPDYAKFDDKTGTVKDIARDHPTRTAVKWDDGHSPDDFPLTKNLTLVKDGNTMYTPTVDAKALAKAYFNGNTAEVERILKPFKVELLPVGAVLEAPTLNLVWVVTKAGVVVVDTHVGISNKSDKTLEDFSRYAEENGFVARVK